MLDVNYLTYYIQVSYEEIFYSISISIRVEKIKWLSENCLTWNRGKVAPYLNGRRSTTVYLVSNMATNSKILTSVFLRWEGTPRELWKLNYRPSQEPGVTHFTVLYWPGTFPLAGTSRPKKKKGKKMNVFFPALPNCTHPGHVSCPVLPAHSSVDPQLQKWSSTVIGRRIPPAAPGAVHQSPFHSQSHWSRRGD